MKKVGHAGMDEPFDGLFTQGMVVHETYRDKEGQWVTPAEIERVRETADALGATVGAVLATHRRRVYDAVVLKVLGARRSNVIGAFAIEFGLVGLSTAIVAAVVGSIAAWLLMRFYMRIEFTLLPA